MHLFLAIINCKRLKNEHLEYTSNVKLCCQIVSFFFFIIIIFFFEGNAIKMVRHQYLLDFSIMSNSFFFSYFHAKKKKEICVHRNLTEWLRFLPLFRQCVVQLHDGIGCIQKPSVGHVVLQLCDPIIQNKRKLDIIRRIRTT